MLNGMDPEALKAMKEMRNIRREDSHDTIRNYF